MGTNKADEPENDDDLKELETDYKRRVEERKKEQVLAAKERQRLEDILVICNEYNNLNLQKKKKKKKSTANDPETLRNDDDDDDDEKTKQSRNNNNWNFKIKTNGSLTSSIVQNRRPDVDVASSKPDRIAELELGASVGPVETGFNRITYRKPKKLPTETFQEDLFFKSDMFRSNDALRMLIADDVFSDGLDDDNASTDYAFQDESVSTVSYDTGELSGSVNAATLSSSSSMKERTRDDRGRNGSNESAASFVTTATGSSVFSAEINSDRKDKNGSACHPKERRCRKWRSDAETVAAAAADRIKILKERISDVRSVEERTVKETETELELLEWESNTLIEQLRREKERIATVNHQQMELLFLAAKEREEAQLRIENERIKLDESEQRYEITRQRCQSTFGAVLKGGENRGMMTEVVVREREELENQRRMFEDLEFHLLEMETRKETEREPLQRKLTAELNQLTQNYNMTKETLKQLAEQKHSLVIQVKSDFIDLEKERLMLLEDFRKEKRKITGALETDQKSINRVKSNSSLQHSSSFSNRSKQSRTNNGTDFNDKWNDCHPPLEQNLPETPSPVSSVLRRLQELELKDVTTMLNDETRTRISRIDQDDAMSTDDLPTSSIVDHLKSWLMDEKMHLSRSFSGSDDEGMSVISANDVFDEDLSNDTSDQSFRNRPDPRYEDQKEVRVTNFQNNHNGDDSCRALQLSQVDTSEVVMRQNQRAQSRPLTRYLPARSDDGFDLRLFVQSSGHSLDNNPHVLVTPTTCRGTLVKMGTRFHLWHRRWFVFDRPRKSIVYYSDQTETKFRGCVLFSAIEDVFVDHMRTVKSPNRKSTFCLKTTVKKFYLVAPSVEAMRIWIDVLFSGAEGYQEFR